jgi:uncharacterized membrane protein YcfT
MKSLIDIIAVVVGLIATGVGVWQFYLFATYRTAQGLPDWQGGTHHLWIAIAALVLLCCSALVLFLRHVNKEEEIHITG